MSLLRWPYQYFAVKVGPCSQERRVCKILCHLNGFVMMITLPSKLIANSFWDFGYVLDELEVRILASHVTGLYARGLDLQVTVRWVS